MALLPMYTAAKPEKAFSGHAVTPTTYICDLHLCNLGALYDKYIMKHIKSYFILLTVFQHVTFL